MKYDLDEVFSAIKQKHWWIICVLSLPAGYYNVINSEMLNNMFSSMFSGSAMPMQNMSGGFGLLLLVYLCLFLSYGYLTDYIKNYAQDIYYQEKEPNFVLYLITGLKMIPFGFFNYIMSIIIAIIPIILLGFCSSFLIIFFPLIGITLTVFLIITNLFIMFTYMICAYLLFVKTNKITSVFRLPTIFTMIFNNKLALLKAMLWIAIILIPILIIQTSLMLISSMPIIFLPIFVFINYSYFILSSNILAQLLRHISQKMGDEL